MKREISDDILEKEVKASMRSFDDVWPEVDYKMKVIEITNKHRLKRKFTNREFANGSYSKYCAEKFLSKNEYDNLLKVREFYLDDSSFEFNYKEWKEYANKILASYDLVAPVYKICRLKKEQKLAKLEQRKIIFRQKARVIISNDKIGQAEWVDLLQEFQKEFKKGYI